MSLKNTGLSDHSGAPGITVSGTDTLTNKTIDADNNTLSNIGLAELNTDFGDIQDIALGMYLDSPSITVTSDGATITLSLEKNGGGDLRIYFSDGVYTLDCTPADTVTLTAGSDVSPQINYIYVLQSTKTLTASTAGWPGTEYAPVATVLCQSASSLQTDGAYKVHAWTDHSKDAQNEGHLAHLNYWIRSQNATWVDGVALTPTAGAGQMDIATSSGNILQLHTHAFPAFDTSTGSDVYVVNDPTTAYKKVGDLTLANVGQDINGTTLGDANTDFYNLVIWGAVNEESGDCKLYLNLPDGVYPNDNGSQAQNDIDQTAIYTIPSDFTGVGFLISRLTIQENAGTYTVVKNTDLRGQFPSTQAGGGAVGGNEFADNVFRIQDDGDNTREIAFQASGITTGNVRTITMPDQDIDLGSLGGASRFDATVGSAGDYTDIQSAITGVGGTDIKLLLIEDTTEDSDISVPTNANLLIHLSSYTLTMGDFSFEYTGVGNVYIRGNGINSGAEIDYTHTTLGDQLFQVANSTSVLDIQDCVIDNNSSTTITGLTEGVELHLTRVRYEGANQASSGISSMRDRSTITDCTIVGGGTSDTAMLNTSSGLQNTITGVRFEGTFSATSTCSIGNGSSATNIVFDHSTNDIQLTIQGGVVSGIACLGSFGVDINISLNDSVLSNAELNGGDIDVTASDNVKLSGVSTTGALDLTDTSCPNFQMINCEIDGAITMGSDNSMVTGCILTGGVTVNSGADDNGFVNCYIGSTNTITVNSGSNRTRIVGCATDVAISDSGTGTVTAGNAVY